MGLIVGVFHLSPSKKAEYKIKCLNFLRMLEMKYKESLIIVYADLNEEYN
jgi:hypothetical protein